MGGTDMMLSRKRDTAAMCTPPQLLSCVGKSFTSCRVRFVNHRRRAEVAPYGSDDASGSIVASLRIDMLLSTFLLPPPPPSTRTFLPALADFCTCVYLYQFPST